MVGVGVGRRRLGPFRCSKSVLAIRHSFTSVILFSQILETFMHACCAVTSVDSWVEVGIPAPAIPKAMMTSMKNGKVVER